MTDLILGSAVFFLIHAVVAGTAVRFRIIEAIGLKIYVPLFAIGSLGGLWWMSTSYNAVREAGVTMLWNAWPWGDWLTAILMLPALLLVVVGLMTKSSTAMKQGKLLEEGDAVTGILRVTRHPFLIGVALWAATHMITNGDLESLIFFGTFLIVVLNGMRNIDRKRLRIHGDAWTKFEDKTSVMPFVAIAQGRNSFNMSEIGLVKPLLGLVVYLALAWSHGMIFGPPTILFAGM